jgi:hypothetical protein
LCIESNGKFSGPSAWISHGYITSCATEGRDGCKGYDPGRALQWVSQHGSPTGGNGPNKDTCVPYWASGDALDHFNGGGRAAPCQSSCTRGTNYPRSISEDKFYSSPVSQSRETPALGGTKDMNQVKRAFQEGGPLVMGFAVYKDFMAYKTGIYSPRGGQKTGLHAVTCLGYGPGYIHCANSWKATWGDRGFFKIKEGSCDMLFIMPTGKPQLSKSAFPLPGGGKGGNSRRRSAPRPAPSPSGRRRRRGKSADWDVKSGYYVVQSSGNFLSSCPSDKGFSRVDTRAGPVCLKKGSSDETNQAKQICQEMSDCKAVATGSQGTTYFSGLFSKPEASPCPAPGFNAYCKGKCQQGAPAPAPPPPSGGG